MGQTKIEQIAAALESLSVAGVLVDMKIINSTMYTKIVEYCLGVIQDLLEEGEE